MAGSCCLPGLLGRPIPRKQCIELVDCRLTGYDPLEDIGKPRLRIKPVQLGRIDQRSQDGKGLATSGVADEHRVFPRESNGLHRTFHYVAVDFERPIIEEGCEPSPVRERIVDGLGESRLG